MQRAVLCAHEKIAQWDIPAMFAMQRKKSSKTNCTQCWKYQTCLILLMLRARTF